MDEITPHTQIESTIFCFRSSRNRSEGQGRCEIGVTAQNPRATYLAHVSSERRENRYESVMERVFRVIVADESVEGKRNVEGEHSNFLGKLKLVPVVDVSIEIGGFRSQ